MCYEAPPTVQLPKPIMGYFPATFLERGLSLPFTTPQLAGARVRPGERVPLEMLVPNPAGGRGIYIIGWTDIGGLCRPTLHDLHLIELVATRQACTPAALRAAAQEVAAEGLAGRAAAAAAAESRAAWDRARLETNFEMLMALLRQVSPTPPGTIETPAAIEARAQATVAELGPELNLPARGVARLLEELADLFVPVGLGGLRATARIPALAAILSTLRQDAMNWWQTRSDERAGRVSSSCGWPRAWPRR